MNIDISYLRKLIKKNYLNYYLLIGSYEEETVNFSNLPYSLLLLKKFWDLSILVDDDDIDDKKIILQEDLKKYKIMILYNIFLEKKKIFSENTTKYILLSGYFNYFNELKLLDYTEMNLLYINFSNLKEISIDIINNIDDNSIIFNTQYIQTYKEDSKVTSIEKLKSFFFFMALNNSINLNLLKWYFIFFHKDLNDDTYDLTYLISIIFELKIPETSRIFLKIFKTYNYPNNIELINKIKDFVENLDPIPDDDDVINILNIHLENLNIQKKTDYLYYFKDIKFDYNKLYQIDPFGAENNFFDFLKYEKKIDLTKTIKIFNTSSIAQFKLPYELIKNNNYICLNIISNIDQKINEYNFSKPIIIDEINKILKKNNIIFDKSLSFEKNTNIYLNFKKELTSIYKSIFGIEPNGYQKFEEYINTFKKHCSGE